MKELVFELCLILGGRRKSRGEFPSFDQGGNELDS